MPYNYEDIFFIHNVLGLAGNNVLKFFNLQGFEESGIPDLPLPQGYDNIYAAYDLFLWIGITVNNTIKFYIYRNEKWNEMPGMDFPLS